jgi:predicted TIM-barrel fold metal-dependent hydrolase
MIVGRDGSEYFVVDGHAHVGTRPFVTTVTSDRGDGSFPPEELLANMDAAGVDMAVIFPRANPHTDYAEQNAAIMEAAAAHPERLIPYVRVQPFFGDEAVAAVTKFAQQGARGLKLHPFMDFAGNAVNRPDVIYPIVEAAIDGGLLILIHSGETWNAHPALIWDLARNFPRGTFIMAHCGLWEGHSSAIVLARDTPNLYLDSAEVAPPAVITNVVRGVGSDRLVFGSDHPAIPYGFEIGKVAKYAGLSSDEIRRVMGGNLAGLLGIDSSRPRAPRVQLGEL